MSPKSFYLSFFLLLIFFDFLSYSLILFSFLYLFSVSLFPVTLWLSFSYSWSRSFVLYLFFSFFFPSLLYISSLRYNLFSTEALASIPLTPCLNLSINRNSSSLVSKQLRKSLHLSSLLSENYLKLFWIFLSFLYSGICFSLSSSSLSIYLLLSFFLHLLLYFSVYLSLFPLSLFLFLSLLLPFLLQST